MIQEEKREEKLKRLIFVNTNKLWLDKARLAI